MNSRSRTRQPRDRLGADACDGQLRATAPSAIHRTILPAHRFLIAHAFMKCCSFDSIEISIGEIHT